MSKARYGKRATAKRIAIGTGLHRGDSVAPALAVLHGHSLVEKTKEGWRALSPSGQAAEWFVRRKSTSEHWYDRLAYFPISLPDRSKLPTRHAVVFWFLVSRSRLSRPQKVAGIAKALCIGWATAGRAVKQLQDLGLIDSELRPTDVRRDDLWLDGKKPGAPKKPQVVDNYRMSALFGPTFPLDCFQRCRANLEQHADQIGTQMRRAGYSEQETGEYILGTYRSFTGDLRGQKMGAFMRFSIEGLFRRAERETQKNRANGRFQGKNSLGLLRHMTEHFVERINKEHESMDDIELHMFCVAA